MELNLRIWKTKILTFSIHVCQDFGQVFALMFLFFYDTLAKSWQVVMRWQWICSLRCWTCGSYVVMPRPFLGYFSIKSTSKGIICSLFQTGPFTVVIDSYRQSYVRDWNPSNDIIAGGSDKGKIMLQLWYGITIIFNYWIHSCTVALAEFNGWKQL